MNTEGKKKWNNVTIKYKVVCETREEFILFANFMKAMGKMKKSKSHKKVNEAS